MATHHELHATTKTAHWGFFDAAIPPVLEIASGDRVTLHSINGGPDILPTSKEFDVLPDHREFLRDFQGKPVPGHIMTGPIAIKGARIGDALEVRILDVKLRQNWGYNSIHPLGGGLPEDFPVRHRTHIFLDRERMVGKLPWGVDLPLNPFFGVMGVAPPKLWGAISSGPPREHGGNIDNKELVAGSTLFLPVHVDGGLFSAGDGHACQGDGEVNSSALETALTGTFEIILRKALKLTMPRAETPTHYITMGMDVDLDDAAKQALREMIVFIVEKTNLSREDAYTLCSLAADLRVTQIVDGNKGIHVMLAKTALHGT